MPGLLRLFACVLAAVVLVACSSSKTDSGAATIAADGSRSIGNPLALPDLSGTGTALPAAVPEVVAPPATSAEAAVAAFVEAEIAGKYGRSYDLLSREDRDAVPARSSWINAHAYLPRLRSFVPTAIEVSGDRAVASGEAAFEPSLDEVRGLIAAQAALQLVAVAEDGGWRVAYRQSKLSPRHLADTSAQEAVRQWVAVQQRCEVPPNDLQHTTVVGSPGLSQRFCGAKGAIKVETPRRLGDRPDPTAVLAAFGAEADVWARSVVAAVGDVSLHAFVAPIGDRWKVIGILKA